MANSLHGSEQTKIKLNCAPNDKASGAMSGTVEVGESQNGKQVAVRLHQTVRVILSESPTTGFRWYLRPAEQTIFSLVEDGLIQPPAERIGGTATHHWDFRAEKAGEATIVFEYVRTWERATTPASTFSFSLRVTKD